MLKIIKYGFLPIISHIGKDQNFKKGIKLLKSSHVRNMVERENENKKLSTTIAQVIAQTNINTKYDVKIIVSIFY